MIQNLNFCGRGVYDMVSAGVWRIHSPSWFCDDRLKLNGEALKGQMPAISHWRASRLEIWYRMAFVGK